MMNEIIITGIDIGTTKVVAVIAELIVDQDGDDSSLKILGMGEHPSYGLKKGIVVDIKETIKSLENAIKWFSLKKIGRSPAKFDNEKLISVNSHYIKVLNNDEIVKFLESYYIRKYKIKIDEISIKRLKLGLNDIKSRSRDMIQLAEMSLFYCSKFPLSLSKKAQKYINKADKTTNNFFNWSE